MSGPFKMYGKSPMMKALIGNQKNLPEHLKQSIEASPAKAGTKYSSTGETTRKGHVKKVLARKEAEGTEKTGAYKSTGATNRKDHVKAVLARKAKS